MKTKSWRKLLGTVLAAVCLLTWMAPALAQDAVQSSQSSGGQVVDSEETTTGVSRIEKLPEIADTATKLPSQPDQRYDVWYGDTVIVTLNVPDGYTASWATGSAVETLSWQTPGTANVCTIPGDSVTGALLLAVRLTPNESDSGTASSLVPLYGLYEIVPFSVAGVNIALDPEAAEDAQTDPLVLPYGAKQTLKGEVVLRDAHDALVPTKITSVAGSSLIYGKSASFAWTVTPNGFAPALTDVDTSSPTLAIPTETPDILGTANVLTYTCTVSGLPSRENAEAGSQKVSVMQPQLALPVGASDTIRAEIGGDATSFMLSWNGTVAAGADLTGAVLTGTKGIPNNPAGAPELTYGTISSSGIPVAVPQLFASSSYTPGTSYEYELQLKAADGTSLSNVLSLEVLLVAKAPKVTSLSASPSADTAGAAVAAGQAVTLTAALKDVVSETAYQWVQSPIAETPDWTPVNVEGAQGQVEAGAMAVPALTVYPAADTMYNLQLGADAETSSLAQTPAYAYVFTLSAAGSTDVGAITGLATQLKVAWKSAAAAGLDQVTGPVQAPTVVWTPASAVTANAQDSLQASVLLPAAQTQAAAVTASYTPDKDAPESAAPVPVTFNVQPVTLQTKNGVYAYTFPEKVGIGNAVDLPVQWSKTPGAWDNVRIHWTATLPAGSGATVAWDTQLAADGSVGVPQFTPDVPGTYTIRGVAYVGTSNASAAEVGGSGVTLTLVAEKIAAGTARILAPGGTVVAINNAIQFQAQIANASGVYQNVTSPLQGSWQMKLPSGAQQDLAGGGSISYTPQAAGTYVLTYTPAAEGSEPASLTFTVTDPQAPAAQPEITLTVLSGGAAAGKTVAPGTSLTAVIAVQNMPAGVTQVTGSISPFGFIATAANSYVISVKNGTGSTQLTYTVPKNAQDGSPLNLALKSANTNVSDVTLAVPEEASWSGKVGVTGDLELSIISPPSATVNQPFTVELAANMDLDPTKTSWSTNPDYRYTQSEDGSKMTFVPIRTGAVTINATAESKSGKKALVSATVNVGTTLAVALSGPPSVEASQQVVVTALPSTSSSDVALQWTLEPSYSYAVSGQSIEFTPTETGTVTVQVTALLGQSTASATLLVPVMEASSPSPSPSASPSGSVSPNPSASPSGSASPSESALPSGSASPSASPSSSPSTSPSPSGSASQGPSTAENSMLRLKPDSNLRLTVRGLDYYVEGIKAVGKVSQATTVAELRNQFETPTRGTIRIVDQQGKPDQATDTVGTGVVVELMVGGYVEESATVLIMGDVLGSGLINIAQLVRMAKDLNGTQVLQGVYRIAGDLNGSGAIDISDLVQEAQMLHRV